jgi:hypothetical protein
LIGLVVVDEDDGLDETILHPPMVIR